MVGELKEEWCPAVNQGLYTAAEVRHDPNDILAAI